MLLFAARSNYNSGVRLDSVDVLTQSSNDTHVRAALMYVLQNDSNPGVRLKALDGLSGFVKQDPQVRDEVLRALISDDNPGVRLQALRLVEPMKSDSNVRAVLAKLAQTDQNVSGPGHAGADAGNGLGIVVRCSLFASCRGIQGFANSERRTAKDVLSKKEDMH